MQAYTKLRYHTIFTPVVAVFIQNNPLCRLDCLQALLTVLFGQQPRGYNLVANVLIDESVVQQQRI